MFHNQSNNRPFLPFFCSINGDGAAEPVLDNMNEGDDDKNAEECSSSWPATFTSPSDAQESEIPEQVVVELNKSKS